MNRKMTGSVIRSLRKKKRITQKELAEKIHVSEKAVSKWETGQGFPDIGLLEPLANALDVSVTELLSGEYVQNNNRSSNVTKSKFYICPDCGNAIWSVGEAVISCCGKVLFPAKAAEPDKEHQVIFEPVEDEFYVRVPHEMTKAHSIAFLAAVSDQEMQFVKLYPESEAEARFKRGRLDSLYYYCNRHGLFRVKRP